MSHFHCTAVLRPYFHYALALVQQISAHPLCAVSSVVNYRDAFLTTPNMARQMNIESFDVLRVIYWTVDLYNYANVIGYIFRTTFMFLKFVFEQFLSLLGSRKKDSVKIPIKLSVTEKFFTSVTSVAEKHPMQTKGKVRLHCNDWHNLCNTTKKITVPFKSDFACMITFYSWYVVLYR